MLRFNHMEITVPPGTIADEGDRLSEFMAEAFGFARESFPAPLDNPSLVLSTDAEGSQFLFVTDHPEPLARASEDHLGFHVDSFGEVDRIHAVALDWQARDPRLEIRDFGVVDFGAWQTRAVYVRYILPIWFDVQHIASTTGEVPAHQWTFGPSGPATNAVA